MNMNNFSYLTMKIKKTVLKMRKLDFHEKFQERVTIMSFKSINKIIQKESSKQNLKHKLKFRKNNLMFQITKVKRSNHVLEKSLVLNFKINSSNNCSKEPSKIQRMEI